MMDTGIFLLTLFLYDTESVAKIHKSLTFSEFTSPHFLRLCAHTRDF